MDDYFLTDLVKIITKFIYDRPSSPRLLTLNSSPKVLSVLEQLTRYNNINNYQPSTSSQWTLHQLVTAAGLEPVDGDLIRLPRGDLLVYNRGRYHLAIDGPLTLTFFSDQLPILSYYPLNYWRDAINYKEIKVYSSYHSATLRYMLQDQGLKVKLVDEDPHFSLIKDGVILTLQLDKLKTDEYPLGEYFPLELEQDIERYIGYHHAGEGFEPEHGVIDEEDRIGGKLSYDDEKGLVIEHKGKTHQLVSIESDQNTYYIPPQIPTLVTYDISYWREAIQNDGYEYGVILNLDHIPEKNRIYKQVLYNLQQSNKHSVSKQSLSSTNKRDWETHFTYSGNKIVIIILNKNISSVINMLTNKIWTLLNDENFFYLT